VPKFKYRVSAKFEGPNGYHAIENRLFEFEHKPTPGEIEKAAVREAARSNLGNELFIQAYDLSVTPL